MNVTKFELCSRVAKRLNRTANDIRPVVDLFLDEVMEVLSDGYRIEIRGFGSFKTKVRKSRIGRNPRTNETVSIPSHTAPVFKFSKDAQKVFEDKTKGKKPTNNKVVPALTKVSAPKISTRSKSETFSPN